MTQGMRMQFWNGVYMQMFIKFGDLVEFDVEYRSCKPVTVNVQQSMSKIENEAYELGVDLWKTITTKTIYPLKKPKVGVYVGSDKINTSIFYDYYEFNYGQNSDDGYIPKRSDFVEVAEIRCEDVKKSYYVPFENVRKYINAKK